MRESIRPGTKINFEGQNGKNFKIESLLSEEGSSSIVYIVCSYDMLGMKHFSVLKQLFPIGLDIKLDEDGRSILIPEKSMESFQFYKNRFKEAYFKQVSFQNIEEAGNKPSDARGIYEGYNTMFIEMQYDRGYCYNNVREENLQDIFKIAKAIAKAVKVYHDNDLLHLDVKPANIFVLNDTKDYIKVFDYDSTLSKEEAALGKVGLSFSTRWAAPELLLGKHQEICEATDYYSIGAVVFNQIFGHTPVSRDLRYDSKFDFTKNNLFDKISPAIYIPLTEFFHKTLQATPGERYQTAKELINALEELIHAASPVNIHLSNHTFSSSPQFIGRASELQWIGEKLNAYGFCFIHGMGGIGKTEIAKQFANINRNYYHTVHAIKYSGDLKKDILDMDFINLDNKTFTDEKGEIDIEKLYKFKKDKIQELDEKTLIIVDNFNTDSDPFLNDIITHSNRHRTLFTTKNEVFGKSEYYMEIKELSPEDSLELFYSFYKNHSEETIISSIIDQIQRNTLCIKLIAASMEKVKISPMEMLTKLQKGIGNDIAVKIKHSRDILDQSIEDQTLFNHLCIVFDTAKLSKEQKYLLMNMWFVSQYEINDRAFLNLLQINYTNELINTFITLIEQNWIHIDNETSVVSLHPIISSVVKMQLQPDIYNCSKLVKSIIKTLGDNNDELLNSKQKISLGEEILKQSEIPIHLLSEIFYGLSLQYNNERGNIKKALEYGEKAEKSYCKLSDAKKSIEEYKALVEEQEGLSNIPDTASKQNNKYYAFLTWLGINPETDDEDEEEFDSYKEYIARNGDLFNYKDLKVLILKNLASLHFQIQQYRKTLGYLRKIGRSPDMLLLGGKCQYYVGEYDNALSIFENALFRYGYNKAEYKGKVNNITALFSKILYKIQMLMLPPYDEDSPLIPEKVSPADAAECLRWIAYCLNKKGDAKKSLHCAELIKKLMTDNNILNYEANMVIADIYEINEEYDKANSHILTAKNQCVSLEEELNTVILTAENKTKTGEFIEVLINWKKAGEIAEFLYGSSHEVNFKIGMNTGDCYLCIKDYQLAQKYYKDLYQIFKDIDYKKILITQKLAKVYALQKQITSSEKLYDEAISSAIDLLGKNTIEVSNLYYEKALLYLENNEDKAIENFQNCLDIRQALLHMEDGEIVACQQELLMLYKKKHDKEKFKIFNKQLKKTNSKIDIGMISSFITIVFSSIAYSIFVGSFFNPLINPLNTAVLAGVYIVGVVLFILTFKLNIEKFTKGFSGAFIILVITFPTIMMQSGINTIISHEREYSSLAVQNIISALKGFGLNNSFYLLPLIILTWFIAYNGFINQKPWKLFFSFIFTGLFAIMVDPIILGIFFFTFVYLIRKNDNEKWIQPNNMEISIMIAFVLYLFLSIFLYAFIRVKYSTFVSIENSISALQSLNLFTLSSETSMLNLNNYPILSLIMHAGILVGLLLSTVYFAFVIHSLRNAKRIKSGYLKTVFQTICVFFLLTGVLNILYSIIDIISQTYLSKVLLVRTVLFPFLSPNPQFLISCFFFGGILFSIYYNRGKE